MNIYIFLSGLRKCYYRRFILILVTFAFGFGNLYAQYIFSINYNDLSQENTNLIKTEVARFNVVSTVSMTRNRDNKEVYSFSSVQNTKIVILNERTGNNVAIIPVEGTPGWTVRKYDGIIIRP